MNIDTRRRLQLSATTVCWIIIAISNSLLTRAHQLFPQLTAGFALATACLSVLLILHPSNEFAYRVGGTLAIGTLFLRITTIVGAVVFTETDIDAPWLLISNFAISILLGFTYGTWWLTDIKLWHQLHKKILP